jgi:hypothetical protein
MWLQTGLQGPGGSLDGRLGVPDRVGDKLADEQFGREGHFLQSPRGNLAGCPGADISHDRRLGGQVPGNDLICAQGTCPGDEQGGIVTGRLWQERTDQAVADCFQRRRPAWLGVYLAEHLVHGRQPRVHLAVARLD